MPAVGSRVEVSHPDTRYDGELGLVVATHPPKTPAPHSFVVRIGGREVICKPEQLKEVAA